MTWDNTNPITVGREFQLFYLSLTDVTESFGLVSKDLNFSEDICAYILQKGFSVSQRMGWQQGTCWVKKLDKKELRNFPARRFTNSVSIYLRNSPSGFFPKPLALVYRGNPLDALTQTKEGYFLSHFVGNKRLYDLFENLSYTKRQAIMQRLGESLRRCAEIGVYPLDFAPRDIVLEPYNSKSKFGIPVIVDTEHVEFGEPNDAKLIKKQRQQFRADYEPFFSERKLDKLESLVFPA